MKFDDDLNQEEIRGQWLRLKAAIERKQESHNRQPVMPRRAWLKYAGIAASLLLLAVAGRWLVTYSPPVVYKTGYGQQRHITLPDSSRVILNANSSISYKEDWLRSGSRKLTLTGEAFFSVVHTTDNRPFVVHTPDGMEVEVLGTEFNVYDRRGMQQVVLNSGSVRLRYDDLDAIGMRPGEMVSRQGTTARPRKTKVDPTRYSAWTRGKLVFENTPLITVCRTIRDNFGLIVSLPDTSLNGRLFNGTFPADRPAVLLKALMTTYQLEVAARDDTGSEKRLRLRTTEKEHLNNSKNERK